MIDGVLLFLLIVIVLFISSIKISIIYFGDCDHVLLASLIINVSKQ